MIISPMILSSIYMWNMDATYYLSAIFSVVAMIIMTYVSTWKNAKMLGKEMKEEKKPDIEMKPIENNTTEVKEESSEIKTSI